MLHYYGAVASTDVSIPIQQTASTNRGYHLLSSHSTTLLSSLEVVIYPFFASLRYITCARSPVVGNLQGVKILHV
jgi:hypothetical protein